MPAPAAALGASRPGRVTSAATAGIVTSIVPVFLTGASSVLIATDLGLEPSDLGFAVGAFFGANAVASAFAGRLVDRWGVRRAMIQAIATSALVLAGIGMFVQDLRGLLVALMLGGVANAVAVPAGALALARGLSSRQALMFGVVQSSIPASTLFAGATIPLFGVRFGWRWAFVIAAGLALASLWLPACLRVADGSGDPRRRRSAQVPLARTLPLVLAMGIGGGAATAIPVYLIPAAVQGGVSVGAAGWLLAAGSLLTIVARVTGGWYADHRGGGALGIIWAMMAIGAIGCSLLAGGGVFLLMAGALVAYAVGFGWTGLLNYATARINPSAPASAAGLVQAGGGAGAALGPVVFGQVAQAHTYAAAWLVTAGCLLVAAGLVLYLKVFLDRAAILGEGQAA